MTAIDANKTDRIFTHIVRHVPTYLKPLMRQLGMNYPVVMGNPKTVNDYGGITAIPTTFVIDRQGNVVTAYEGFTDQGTFESVIDPLLENAQG